MKYWPVVAFIGSIALSAVAGLAASNESNEQYKSSIDTRIAVTTPLREETRKQVNDHEGRLVRLETQEGFTRSDIAEIKADVKELVHVEHVERSEASAK